MKRHPIFLVQLICAAGGATSLLPAASGPSTSAELEVRWVAPSNLWPSAVWVYRVESTVFDPAVISNLMQITGYSKSDETGYGTNGMVFSNSKRTGNLRVSFPEGSVDYWTAAPSYNGTNLAEGVPEEKELFRLTTNLLAALGIGSSELLRKKDRDEPMLFYFQTQSVFSHQGRFVTNITSREAHFRRCLDGIEFIGFDRGGDGRIKFGDHAKILEIAFSWRKTIRDKLFPAVTPKTIIQRIRDRKLLPENVPGAASLPIHDWTGVKRVTITDARLCFLGPSGPDRQALPAVLRPFAVLDATVETSATNLPVVFYCPAVEAQESEKGK